MAEADESDEVSVPLLICSEQDKMVVLLAVSHPAFTPVPWRKVDLAADNRLNFALLCLFVELDRPAHYPVVGKSEGVHTAGYGFVEERRDLAGRIQNAILGMGM